MKSDLGDRMKSYEAIYNGVSFDGSNPVMVRLDGRSFHTLTRKISRPFDKWFRSCMEYVTMQLCEEFNAVIGYTQSDEITLVLYAPREESSLDFGGKLFKLTSVIASSCSNKFNYYQIDDNKAYKLGREAQFDCRVFEVPSESEAINCLLWRQQDCFRNSVLSISQVRYGKKNIHGLKVVDLVEKLRVDGIDIYSEYSDLDLYGRYVFKGEDGREVHHVKFIGENHNSLIEFVFGMFHGEDINVE